MTTRTTSRTCSGPTTARTCSGCSSRRRRRASFMSTRNRGRWRLVGRPGSLCGAPPEPRGPYLPPQERLHELSMSDPQPREADQASTHRNRSTSIEPTVNRGPAVPTASWNWWAGMVEAWIPQPLFLGDAALPGPGAATSSRRASTSRSAASVRSTTFRAARWRCARRARGSVSEALGVADRAADDPARRTRRARAWSSCGSRWTTRSTRSRMILTRRPPVAAHRAARRGHQQRRPERRAPAPDGDRRGARGATTACASRPIRSCATVLWGWRGESFEPDEVADAGAAPRTRSIATLRRELSALLTREEVEATCTAGPTGSCGTAGCRCRTRTGT